MKKLITNLWECIRSKYTRKETNMIGYKITRPNAKIYIMRGISGAGKSTIAYDLSKKYGGIILSADAEILSIGNGDYSKGYSYVSDDGRTAISIAHARVFGKFRDLVVYEPCIIIDNTNLNRSSIKRFVETALISGYDEDNIEIVDIGLNGLTAEQLAERNSHNVNIDTINKMITSYNSAGKIEVKTIFEFNTDEEERVYKEKEKFINVLNHYYDNGWLIKHTNEELGLIIWNYSVKTTYEGKWDNVTRICRSLVTDFDGIIVSRGFDKFFNYEEIKYQFDAEDFKDSVFYEKVDGSYIGVFWYKDRWIARSKGSFDTDQAKRAIEFFNAYSCETKAKFKKGLTHNFEVLYPENQIVVDYKGYEGLVYLATTSNKGHHFVIEYLTDEVKTANKYDFVMDYDKIKAMDDGINEGFVGRTKKGMLFKIKFETYKINHAIITNTSSYDIWSAMVNGTIEDIIAIIPDECYDFVKSTRESIQTDYDNMYADIMSSYDALEKDGMSMKDFAIKYKNHKYSSFFFKLFKGEEINEEVIWKRVKPEYRRPFSV